MRTCIATRRRYPATELLRIVLDPQNNNQVIPDPRGCIAGRGAWVEPTLSAWEQVEKRRVLGRALRVSAAVDTSPVRHYLAGLSSNPSGFSEVKQTAKNGTKKLQRKTEP
ncbi:YlxR family protein [Corynebacterium caspium]|uniref:YlxR family protein n=1 Tax=Corynebacterium caspium TaxID=234828 RepID=UPI0003617B9B|nr:YlxR family protein [Corynebacterium caspium]WKD59088.1 hypothetical protein CCASP_03420 [Corynebacterium caspium DSM 44850]